ncbi:MoxR family ATPase [Pedobacter sp. ISL-68]|uniref:AAA family ATPase n=1 Tax=unclassified Pedobacter TaxID=2628915 RepID=UPI001BE7DB9E|nr:MULTISPECIES: MoxR family ATPase [unclassified Pedobacter]MBT2559616.1 MoxR family ATPase [Pedobacter sp. ISL-64]MBT2591921.1 MoxR family ATPase [Pedobacter sp. ISL-68]
MEQEQFNPRTDLSALNEAVNQIRNVLGNIIIGQKQVIDFLIVGLLADGHILIEGVPGVAKTLSAKLLAKSIDAQFSRVQFTPDLMPSDVLGTPIFNTKIGDFEFRKGPIFGNIILVDEINRAPAKTQSALFEVMEERQVTIDGHTYIMDEPFMVLATQNPIEQEGTYRLPEAQLDRFLFKIEVKYPSLAEETAILMAQHTLVNKTLLNDVKPVLSVKQIQEARAIIRNLFVEPKLLEFIAKIVNETRNNSSLYLGASPRASLAIVHSAKAFAAIQNRDFVTPEDIIAVAGPVLAHRILLSPEKEMEGLTTSDIVNQIIKKIEVPR